jgi:hypothetical protein
MVLKTIKWLGMMVHACNSSTQEADTRLQVRGQPGLIIRACLKNK